MKLLSVREAVQIERPTWCWPSPGLDPDSRHCCVQTEQPPRGPDLATYSQDEQFALGNAPTWDSPDIITNFWNPFHLEPEAQVTVRNLSPDVSAVNAQIAVFVSSFGIGMQRSMLSSLTINLAPGQQQTLLFPLTQALLNAADQRIATFVVITHPYDVKLINNRGSQLLADAYTSNVGRSFSVTFPVLNNSASAQSIALSALPNAISATVTPANASYAPMEQKVATLSIVVPSGIHGTGGAAVRQDATVVGRAADGSLINGLTYVVWIDD